MSAQTIYITKGSTNVTRDIGPLLQDNSGANPGDPLTGLVFNSASLVCYFREGATSTVTQLTLATQTVGGAHTDGGFVQLSATNMPGMYRLDLSDTIVSGTNDAAAVTLAGFADLASHTIHIILLNLDLYDAVRAGLTALPNAAADAAGGLVISDAGGLDADAMNAAAVRLTAVRAQVLTDWINAGRLDLILDIIAADVVNIDGAAMRGTDSAALASAYTATRAGYLDNINGHTAQTGDSFARLATYRLGELMSAVLASQPFTGSLLGDLTQDDPDTAGTQQFTIAALNRVWDEALTGATHNINTSSGRRLRQLQDVGNYNGQVHIDTVDGTAGTTIGENGTIDNPVLTLADAITLNNTLQYDSFKISSGSSISLGQAFTGFTFIGLGWTLAFGGQTCNNCVFAGVLDASGTLVGTGIECFRVHLNTVTIPADIQLNQCRLTGPLTMGNAGTYTMHQCYSGISGSDSVSLTWPGSGSSELSCRLHSGGWTFETMTASDTCTLEGFGQLVEGTCTGGAVEKRGHWKQTDITNITVDDEVNFSITDTQAGLATSAALATAQLDLDTITGSDGTTLATTQGNYAPNVVVPDAAGTAPTAVENRQEMDTNSADLNTIITTLGTAGAGLTDLGGMSTGMQAEVNTEVDTALNTAIPGGSTADSINQRVLAIDTLTEASGAGDLAAILVDTGTTLPSIIDDLAIKRNTAFSNFEFLMVLSSDNVTPATGLTVTGERSIDGGAFTGVGGTIAEVSNGIYQFDALAADTNGVVITWRFSSATANDTFITFQTVV